MDQNRRKFLKVLFIGSGAFLIEKLSGSLFSKFFSNPPIKTSLLDKSDFNKNDLKSFRVVENNERLSIYDTSGEEIFQVDKKGGA